MNAPAVGDTVARAPSVDSRRPTAGDAPSARPPRRGTARRRSTRPCAERDLSAATPAGATARPTSPRDRVEPDSGFLARVAGGRCPRRSVDRARRRGDRAARSSSGSATSKATRARLTGVGASGDAEMITPRTAATSPCTTKCTVDAAGIAPTRTGDGPVSSQSHDVVPSPGGGASPVRYPDPFAPSSASPPVTPAGVRSTPWRVPGAARTCATPPFAAAGSIRPPGEPGPEGVRPGEQHHHDRGGDHGRGRGTDPARPRTGAALPSPCALRVDRAGGRGPARERSRHDAVFEFGRRRDLVEREQREHRFVVGDRRRRRRARRRRARRRRARARSRGLRRPRRRSRRDLPRAQRGAQLLHAHADAVLHGAFRPRSSSRATSRYESPSK